MEKKLKILALGDSPTCATGFAQVMRNILKILVDTGKYDIDLVGVNHDGSPYDRNLYPYNIYPAMNALIPDPKYCRDPYGKQLFLDMLGTGNYDLVFILQDSFVIQPMARLIRETYDALPPDRRFKFIFYYPIDAQPKYEWINESVYLADLPVVYTNYGYHETLRVMQDMVGNTQFDEARKTIEQEKVNELKRKLSIIYHGTNVRNFFPLSDEKKKELKTKNFGAENAKKFIFMNVNRNQSRKDLARSMLALKKLYELRGDKKDVYAYFHCQIADSGFYLIDIGKQLQLTEGIDYAFPNLQMFSASKGIPIEKLNELYNSVDCIFSTTLGEGWGLSLTEAMATKTPAIFPSNTSIPEIIGNDGERGFLVASGKNLGDYVVCGNDNSRWRPLTDVEELAQKMSWVVDHKEELKPMIENAYNWAVSYSWDSKLIGEKWLSIFEKAGLFLQTEKGLWNGTVKLDRNDICPICEVKYKRCKHYEQNEKDKIRWSLLSDGQTIQKSEESLQGMRKPV